MRSRTSAPDTAAVVLRLADGRQLAYAEYGDPDGVPVFGFHGTPGSHLELSVAHRAARDAGVRLIVPDRPGYGYSDFVPRRRLVDWPADVTAIADHLGIGRFGVLGVSGGGPHALACAHAFGRRLSGVVVVSSPAPLRVVEALPSAAHRLRRFAAIARSPGLTRPFIAVLVWIMRWFPRAVLAAAAHVVPRADRSVVAEPAYRQLFEDEARRVSRTTARAAAQDLSLFAHDWAFPLRTLAVPVHVWHGDADRLVEPVQADVLARDIPTSTLWMCPGQGHYLFVACMPNVFAVLRESAALAA